jgi:spermidine/putrescine transport system permease protein
MSAVAGRAEPEVARPPLRRRARGPVILPIFSLGMIAYLALPVFVMILYGFNDIPGERQTFHFYGFTLHWWKDIFANHELNQALLTSVIKVAPASAFISTILGTLAGVAIGRYSYRGRSIVNFVIFLAIAVPEIVLGSSLLNMFVRVNAYHQNGVFPFFFGIHLGIQSILLSHIGFSIAFVAVTVRARVQGLDRSLENAAQDLFATPVQAFFKVTLPLIMPGIMAGFLLAFVLSLDDFVITNFVYGQTATFPIWVYGATRIGVPPQVNVWGTVLFGAGVLAAVANVVVGGLRESGA